MYLRKIKFENFEKYVPSVDFVGKYGIPEIKPDDFCGTDFIGFNYAKTEKNKADKAVHFFLDDYQFKRIWEYPERYVDLLKQFSCVLSPDFSLYADMPKALQIYNHYRKHFVATFWQDRGAKVIPTICWSDKESYDFCFDGEPKGSTVAISSVGARGNAEEKKRFIDGYNEMLERLSPAKIIFYGDVPDECHENIVRIRKFTDKWKEAITDGR